MSLLCSQDSDYICERECYKFVIKKKVVEEIAII